MSFLKHKRKEMTERLTGKRTKLKRRLYASAAIAVILGGMVTQTTPHVLAAPINGTHNSVGVDPDAKRTAFEDAATHPDANKSFTSITVNTPDEVVNDATYKATAIAKKTIARPKTLADFLNAWKDSNVSYIEIGSDISSASITSTARPNGALPLIVQGNGYTVDLSGTNLKLAAITSDTTVTLNNINFKEDMTVGSGAESSAFLAAASGTGTKLTVNIHNMSLSRSNATSTTKGPIYGVYATGARVVFSGDSTFDIAGSLTRKVGSVEIANNASVTTTRNAADLYTGVFDFDRPPANSVTKVNGLVMGDGSSNIATLYSATGTNSNNSAKAENTQVISGKLDIVKTGDSVYWYQNNFGYFIRAQSYDSPDFIFGQKNKIEIPKVGNGNSFTVAFNKSFVFNAGTELDMRQMLTNNYSPIQTSSGSIKFISPLKLHMGIYAPNGTSKAGQIIYAAEDSPLYITNSILQAWSGTAASPSAASYTSTFRTLKKDSRGSMIDGSGSWNKTIFGDSTREFQIDGSGVGKVKINYIDQNGNKVGATDMPLVDNYNFIGQSFNLATKEFAIDKMPAGYKWAIDEQVYSGAPKDDSKGRNGQPDGDGTDDDDNGDRFGQANYAIVPMKGKTYTYNIYVYSEGNPNVTYTYVDPWTNVEIPSSKVTIGSEKARNYVPAHVGNTINWADAFYTKTNVPTGYVYVPSNLLPPTVTQPAKTTIMDATTPINVQIYVYDPSYKGALELSKVPDIDFGNQLISPGNRGNIYPATFSDDLTVTDDRRSVKDGWHISVQQTAPLTSTDGKSVLRNLLFFREVAGGTLKPLEGSGDLVVYDYVSQAGLGIQETVKPTSNWNKKNDGAGFYLKDNSKLKAGDYSTVLTWTLGAGPSQ